MLDQRHAPAPFFKPGRVPTPTAGSWVAPGLAWTGSVEEIFFFIPPGIEPLTAHPATSHYTDYTYATHLIFPRDHDYTFSIHLAHLGTITSMHNEQYSKREKN